MDSNLQREHAHAFLDRLPPDQLTAVCGLLESMLSPLERGLALADLDDEPLAVSEAAALDDAADSIRRNGGVSLGDVLADLGLTQDDFERMARTPLPGESDR